MKNIEKQFSDLGGLTRAFLGRSIQGLPEVPDLDLNVLPPVLPQRRANVSVTKKVWRKIVQLGAEAATVPSFLARGSSSRCLFVGIGFGVHTLTRTLIED